MKVSARNVFKGKVTKLIDGAVNAEVELTTAGGDKVVSMITESSVKSLELAVGKDVIAIVKAPWVTVVTGNSGIRFSTRNQLHGKVKSIATGAINTEVGIALPGGETVFAVITNDAAKELELKEGLEATALIKASHVVLGVQA
jgi:molybdate transport system regulatory protein